MRALLLGLLFAPGVLFPQSSNSELPPGVLLLSRVKARVKQQFAHMPQYTCLETLQRFHKFGGMKTENQLDTVRLEVLFSGNLEFFDYPGGSDFRESNPSRFVSTGMIGNGMFASHLQNIFVQDHGLFEYRGEEDLAGRRVARFKFHVSALESGFNIRVAGAQATVATEGVFWADPKTYDLIRIEIDAADIPPILQTSQMITVVDYAPAQIGPQETLLAQRGSLLLAQQSGEVSRDLFEFTQCHEFHAESSINFGDSGTPAASGGPSTSHGKFAAPTKTVPVGLTVRIALTAPLTDRAVVGDVIQGKIVGDVIGADGTFIRDGALVRGRIRRLERFADFGAHFLIGLEFTEIDVEGDPMRFFAALQSTDTVRDMERSAGGSLSLPDLPGVGAFFLRGTHFELPAGFSMTWKTRAM